MTESLLALMLSFLQFYQENIFRTLLLTAKKGGGMLFCSA